MPVHVRYGAHPFALLGSSCSLPLSAPCGSHRSSLETHPCYGCCQGWVVLLLGFLSLQCLVAGCSLAGWKSLLYPGHVNLVAKFCPSWLCFPSLPTPINKSSHPSFFDWSKTEWLRGVCVAIAAAWRKYCLPFGWDRQLPRNSSCPA